MQQKGPYVTCYESRRTEQFAQWSAVQILKETKHAPCTSRKTHKTFACGYILSCPFLLQRVSSKQTSRVCGGVLKILHGTDAV